MEQKDIINKINKVIDKIRPYLQGDGGDVIFKKYENGVVYVSLRGACSHCSMASYTLQDLVEEALVQEIDEVVKVVSV